MNRAYNGKLYLAYHQFAVKGFELNVTDYLLKPFNFERFQMAVERAQENLLKNSKLADRKFIYVKTDSRLVKIFFDEILFIEGKRDYRKIWTKSGSIMTLQTFHKIEQQIEQHLICRVHRSYMVAVDNIQSIESNCIRSEDAVIPISLTYKKLFLK